MGRAIGFKLRTLVVDDQGDTKKKTANGGNRREQKLKNEIKKLRQIVAKKATTYTEGDNREKQPREKRNLLRN